jgi:hypothetical protein
MRPARRPGIHEMSDEYVLLVTKHKITGAERVDWWPSRKEAEESNLLVLEERGRRKVEKHKKDWKGLASLLHIVLGKSGTQDYYTRRRGLDQREFFESVEEKKYRRDGRKID